MMFQSKNALKILTLLKENSIKPSPQPLESGTIATELELSQGDTQELIKNLNNNGVVEAEVDGNRCIITLKGVHWIEQYT